MVCQLHTFYGGPGTRTDCSLHWAVSGMGGLGLPIYSFSRPSPELVMDYMHGEQVKRKKSKEKKKKKRSDKNTELVSNISLVSSNSSTCGSQLRLFFFYL